MSCSRIEVTRVASAGGQPLARTARVWLDPKSGTTHRNHAANEVLGAGYKELPTPPGALRRWRSHNYTVEAVPGQRDALVPPLQPLADPQAFKADAGKPRFELLTDGMPNALLDVVKVLTWAVQTKKDAPWPEGGKGYVPHSWREVPEAKRRYRAALQRHENAIARGEVNDPESGLPHRAHVATNAMFLAELDYIYPETGMPKLDNAVRAVRNAVFCGLSDSLAAAIDTGNLDEAVEVRANAHEALMAGQITIDQRAELEVDFDIAFPDYAD